MQKRLHLVEDDTLARELRRGSKQLRPRHRAPEAMRFPEPEDGAGHRDGHRAGVEGLLRVAVVDDDPDEILRRGRSLGDGDEEVEEPRARLPRGVDEEEAAAARTGERALADPGDCGGRDAGVHGIAACAQNVRSGLCGERVTGC